MTCGHWIISVLLASAIPIALVGGLWNREKMRQANDESKGGIGWQFIRYLVLSTAIPIIGLLALNDALSAQAATLLGTVAGFAFGRKGEP